MASNDQQWDSGPEACADCGSPKMYVRLRSIRMADGGRETLCQQCFGEACEAGRVAPARADQGWRGY